MTRKSSRLKKLSEKFEEEESIVETEKIPKKRGRKPKA
jgi:hypothetical protein